MLPDQWTLNRLNFEGFWQGSASWFARDASGAMDLTAPDRIIDPTTYAISFSNPDTGVWDGSGLFFVPGGKATYAISRSSYNAGGRCWQFPGAGGQSSLALDQDCNRFGHEINLFRGRSRSMLVLIWEPNGPLWSLQRVGAVAFRCRHALEPEGDRPKCGTPSDLLDALRGWNGTRYVFVPRPGVDGQLNALQPVVFSPKFLLRNRCSAVVSDGLVFSVPDPLPDGAFQLEVGGLLAPDLYQQISILFNADGRLTAWEQCCFRPPTFDSEQSAAHQLCPEPVTGLECPSVSRNLEQ